MKSAGFVIDEKDQALQDASVYLTDASGKPLGAGTRSDKNGYFMLESDMLGKEGVFVTISYVGRQPVTLSPADVYDQWEITLVPAGEMEAAVVTAKRKKKIPRQNYAIVWGLATASVALGTFLMLKKFA